MYKKFKNKYGGKSLAQLISISDSSNPQLLYGGI